MDKAIHPLDQTHIKALASLHQILFNPAWKEKDFIDLLQKKGMKGWGYFKKSHLVGFVFCQILFEDAEIMTLGVHPSHQQQGIARALLREMMDFCYEHKVERIFLDVKESNQKAINLYESLEFAIQRKRDHYYNNQENALIFIHSLNQK